MRQYRDLVLMEIPEEDAVSRAAHFNEKTQQQSAGVEKRMRDKMGKMMPSAAIFGEIKIS